MNTRIGYEDVDRLLTYPDAHNLSGSVLPLRPATGPTRVLAQLRGAGPLPDRRSPRRLEARVKGLKDKTCWFVATFRLAGAGKSVLKVVGANLKDGRNVLVVL